MSRGRSARRPHGLLAVVAAVVALGAASAPPVAAEGLTTITFGSAGSVVIDVSPSSGRGDQITLNFASSTAPLPTKFVIDVPAGYTLDLTAPPGTAISDARLSVVGLDSPSFATAYGEFVARDPAAYLSDPAAQACAPGLHAAVWSFSTVLATLKVDVTVFVDRGADPGGGYRLQSCPTGLGESDAQSAATIGFVGLDLGTPKARGRYVWQTFVTPRSAPTYELQAIASLPQSLTLRGRYDERRRTAVVTGRLIEGGKPAARREVFVTGLTGNSGFGRPVATRADGTFSLRARIKGTTDFSASAVPSAAPCAGSSTAPGGCLGALIVPPDGARTTVWVRRRGEAQRALRPVDQRLAERENIAAADLPPAFEEDESPQSRCSEPRNEADLTITGESRRAFVSFGDVDTGSAAAAFGLARVYATRGQAAAAFSREALLATARCALELPRGMKLRPLRLPSLPARVRAYRATFRDGDLRGNADLVFLQRGRSVARLRFVTFNVSPTIERDAIARVASRMR